MALNAHWRVMPPPAETLVRIGAVLGLKPPAPPPRAEAPQAPAPDQDFDELLQGMTVRPMPKILKPEEYLARKEGRREQE